MDKDGSPPKHPHARSTWEHCERSPKTTAIAGREHRRKRFTEWEAGWTKAAEETLPLPVAAMAAPRQPDLSAAVSTILPILGAFTTVSQTHCTTLQTARGSINQTTHTGAATSRRIKICKSTCSRSTQIHQQPHFCRPFSAKKQRYLY